MKNQILKHILFWVLIAFALTIYFGRINADYIQSFYFVTMLMPIAVATAYFFNYYLVPKYLLTKKYWGFTLYLTYIIIGTLYLEMLAMVAAFILLANYQYDRMNPLAVDPISVAITIYLVVFALSIIRLIRFFHQLNSENEQLQQKIVNEKKSTLIVVSNRKKVPISLDDISHIESLADYVQIFHNNKKTLTKEKISKLEQQLPGNFIRIHRSFIINRIHIQSFSSDFVKVGESELPISRTYKRNVSELL